MVKSFHAAIADSTVFNFVSHVEVANVASKRLVGRRVRNRGVTVTDDNSKYDNGNCEDHK
jgi:hypothetical protein